MNELRYFCDLAERVGVPTKENKGYPIFSAIHNLCCEKDFPAKDLLSVLPENFIANGDADDFEVFYAVQYNSDDRFDPMFYVWDSKYDVGYDVEVVDELVLGASKFTGRKEAFALYENVAKEIPFPSDAYVSVVITYKGDILFTSSVKEEIT